MTTPEIIPPPEVGSSAIVLPWVGRLHHDREEFSDWGWIRDEVGSLILTVKLPPGFDVHGPEANAHRRNGTDPTQSRVDALLAAVNGQNDKLTDSRP